MTGALRVLVVDDHPVVLAGLTALIDAADDLTVCGAAKSVAEVRAVAADLAPDVCVLDLQLPDGDGITLGRTLKQQWPTTRVLILTMSDDPGAVVRSLGTGLDGYLLKDSDPHELLTAIRSVATGATVLGRGTSAPVVAASNAAPDTSPLRALDARDREILALLVAGLTTTQVAHRVFLAPKTVRNRISGLMGKLGVTTRDEAVSLGRAAGL
ncbi:response regulator transcription factor [Nocardioides glacieisoli]|uniref:Response regulator transcription factor n=1 Tax=Nocardioides glacieisoli TaxID=1168730 RepID=A0A4Q2RNB4_9ACTN|nr:response regulator transcription factor [Nocardioides glacieisoli]RYB89896.1 response regulator transcription factor [Nocardioides glacieisoli]